MKRWNAIMAVLLAVTFLAVFAVNANAQDKNDLKKEAAKVLTTDKKGDCAKNCQEKQTKTECKDHDPAKCDHEKCDGNHQSGSADGPKKPCTGECKDHKPGECKHSEQTQKQSTGKDKK